MATRSIFASGPVGRVATSINSRSAAAMRFIASERGRAAPASGGSSGATGADAPGVAIAAVSELTSRLCCLPLPAETAREPSGRKARRTSMPKISSRVGTTLP